MSKLTFFYPDQENEENYESKNPNLDLFLFQNYQKKISNSENIGDFLYNIAMAYNIPLTQRQQKHFDLNASCKRGEHYMMADCFNCGTRTFMKIPCNSFFCRECRKYLTSRVKRNAKKYFWNCNHFYGTFTLPPEIQEKITSWSGSYGSNEFISEKRYYYVDLVYKSVSDSINEYYKKHNIKGGFVLLPHSYGSEKLNWFFHINALISSKALSTKNIIKTKFVYDFKKEIWKPEFTYESVDYQINYNELRSIYKKHLSKNFNRGLKSTPQIRFAKQKGSIYIPYKKSIKIVLDYFRHIPLGMKNIISVSEGYVTYQTSKAKQEKTFPTKASLRDFFNLIMQHIPPQNFRTMRHFGLYANSNKKRLGYPIGEQNPTKDLRCEKCNDKMDGKNFIGLIRNNMLVWLNPERIAESSIFFCKPNSMLDYKDFDLSDFQNYPEIEASGRLINPADPPPDMKPIEKPTFPDSDVNFSYSEIYEN